MSDEKIIDVAALIEGRKLNRFHVLTVGLGFLIFLVEGLDYSAASVAAPAMLRAFHGERSAMGIVFGAGNFGFLIGSLAFGFIGDRFGRKGGAILGVVSYSVPALLAVFATSLDEMAVLRFITGIGLGGVFPTAIALLNETAPRKFRASFVTFAFIGYAVGNSTTGQLGAWLIAPFGWQAMFLAAGLAGLVLSGILALWLPESVRFLTIHKPQSTALRQSIARLAPDVTLYPDTRFVLNQPPKANFALRQLFQGRLRWATPLLWLNYFAEGIMYLTLLTWLPTLMESLGLPPQQASLAFSYATAGGIIAILFLSRLLDRFGPPATIVTALGAIAALVYLGTPGLSQSTIIWMTILAITCGTGTHSSLHGTVGHFYPTSIRANGVGYATGMSRIASILGPIVTGYLLSAKLPMQEVLYILVAPYLLVVLICIALGRLYTASSEAELHDAVRAKPAIEGGIG
jgi:AAHS family 4-hydroxybenzoate transporter-like MFS transporter